MYIHQSAAGRIAHLVRCGHGSQVKRLLTGANNKWRFPIGHELLMADSKQGVRFLGWRDREAREAHYHCALHGLRNGDPAHAVLCTTHNIEFPEDCWRRCIISVLQDGNARRAKLAAERSGVRPDARVLRRLAKLAASHQLPPAVGALCHRWLGETEEAEAILKHALQTNEVGLAETLATIEAVDAKVPLDQLRQKIALEARSILPASRLVAFLDRKNPFHRAVARALWLKIRGKDRERNVLQLLLFLGNRRAINEILVKMLAEGSDERLIVWSHDLGGNCMTAKIRERALKHVLQHGTSRQIMNFCQRQSCRLSPEELIDLYCRNDGSANDRDVVRAWIRNRALVDGRRLIQGLRKRGKRQLLISLEKSFREHDSIALAVEARKALGRQVPAKLQVQLGLRKLQEGKFKAAARIFRACRHHPTKTELFNAASWSGSTKHSVKLWGLYLREVNRSTRQSSVATR